MSHNCRCDGCNAARAGDPVGTIRRSDTGVIAVRQAFRSGWVLIDTLQPKNTALATACTWPVIYSPEASS